MKFFHKKYLIAAFLLFFIALLFYNTNGLGRLLYPIQYKEDIQITADNFQMDPLFIASIIRTESNYKPDLVSKANAIGLMQIMPDTIDWIVEKAGYSPLIKSHVTDADVNIEMGTWYLHWIEKRYAGMIEHRQQIEGAQYSEDKIAVIAAAYNAGHNKVSEWLNQEIWDGQYQSLNQIPYGETRHYIKRVIYYYKKYHVFYAKGME